MEVIAGDDRGTRAKVLRVLPTKGKLVVEGVNRVYKHIRRSQKNPQGGRLSKEMPIAISNVHAGLPRLRASRRAPARGCHDDGSKERYCKKCSGNALGELVARPQKQARQCRSKHRVAKSLTRSDTYERHGQESKKARRRSRRRSRAAADAAPAGALSRRRCCPALAEEARPQQPPCRCRGWKRS